MSACHLKTDNWNRVIETADKVRYELRSTWYYLTILILKALKLNENNFKAMFRKGKALGELGFVERAERVLNDLLKKNPAGTSLVSDLQIPRFYIFISTDAPTINLELNSIFAKDKEREKKHNAKFRGN